MQSEIVFASITPPAPTTFAFKCSRPTPTRCLSANGVSWLPLCFKTTYGSSPTDRANCQCSRRRLVRHRLPWLLCEYTKGSEPELVSPAALSASNRRSRERQLSRGRTLSLSGLNLIL